jgi:4-amino-4-deoxy-L-arabinose transferase-like glycosyltransferase
VKRATIFYLTASAVVAYFYGFPTNGLSHFDEGQYAFARVWPWIDKFDVDQAFFSPPLYPFLVGLVQHLPISRPDLAGVYISHAACWASLYFGVKLAVAWWGRSAAFPAFVLLLLSPMRLAFGTIGLTDALFTALLLATLLASTYAFRQSSTRWTIATALLAGLTWTCKYNGFIAVGVVFGFFLNRPSIGSFVRWLVIAIVAAAMMAPWYWAINVHHPEGLAALQRHQQGYLRGLSSAAAWENLCHGFSLRSVLPGHSTLLVCWLLVGIAAFSTRRWIASLILAIILTAEESSLNRLMPIVAIGLLPISLLASRRSVRLPLLLAVGATVALPGVYTPYLRLWLPGEHILMILIASGGAAIARPWRKTQPRFALVGVAALLVLIPSFIKVSYYMWALVGKRRPDFLMKLDHELYHARLPMHRVDGYWTAAQDVVDSVDSKELTELLVFARPPFLYYLANSRLRNPVKRLPDVDLALDRLTPGTYLLADIAVRDSKPFAASLRRAKRLRMLQRIDGWPVSPHPLTMLDDYGSLSAMDRGAYNLNLYLIAPFDGSGK